MMSPTQNECHSFQLIDGKGEFDDKGLHNFITATNLSKCGVDCAVIAIIGAQSSGKSTFLNHFGGTNFEVMNPQRREQTTQGIWISNCVTIDRPFTIAMDIEGTDGEERGEDDTAFEGQSALFALAVADILIVNLWYHDIGRQNAANIPLLRTILQIRMTRVRMDRSRNAKLCFIIRDMEKTPLELLEEKIKRNMEKIWTTIARSNGFKRTNISDFFHVLVFGLPHYNHQRKEFEAQVAELREKIISVDREGVVPAVAFQENAHQLWKTIKENPFLDHPAHSEMIAEHMCKKIANTCLESLTSSKDLMELKKEVEAGPVNKFGDKLHCLMETTLSKYLSEVQHFKEHIVKEREKVLKSEILEILHPLYVTMLGHVRNETFQEFKMRLTKLQMQGVPFVAAYKESYNICKHMLEEKCKDVVEKLSARWDWLGCNKELCNEIENYASSKHKEECQKLKVADYITRSLEDQLQNCTEDTYWASIREVVRMSTSEDNGIMFSYAVATDWEDTSLSDKMTQELKTYARNVVVDKLRAEVDTNVVKRMITRYGSVFCSDLVDLKKHAEAIKREASAAAKKLLSVMAVVQFDEKSNNCIEEVLLSSLMDANSSTTHHLDINKWEGVSEDDTIIAPRKCKSLWSQFNDAVENKVEKVMSDMKKIKWMKGKEIGMQIMSVVSECVGPMVGAAGILETGMTGDSTLTSATPFVTTISKVLAQNFEKEKHETKQKKEALEERHKQRCHQLFHVDQPSSQ